MPIKSFKLLPAEYRQIPNQMIEQYPSDFGVDLNGKTNAWEAIVLIPFVDDTQVLAEEKRLFDSGFGLKDSDRVRNSIDFAFMSYKYNPSGGQKMLKSTLSSFN